MQQTCAGDSWNIETWRHCIERQRQAREQQLERGLSTVSVISWAVCRDSGSENSGAQQYEGFVHDGSSNQIRMGLLKHVLPQKVVSDAIEIIQATFQEIHPGRGNDYTEHH